MKCAFLRKCSELGILCHQNGNPAPGRKECRNGWNGKKHTFGCKLPLICCKKIAEGLPVCFNHPEGSRKSWNGCKNKAILIPALLGADTW